MGFEIKSITAFYRLLETGNFYISQLKYHYQREKCPQKNQNTVRTKSNRRWIER